MFTGEYWYSMDSKGRISVPAKLRESLGDEFKICKGFDKCVCIYPIKDWEEFAQKIKSLPETSQRRARRYFFSGTVDGVLDSQGRITVTPAYKQFASLEKDVVIIGNDNHIEIWDSSVWESEQEFMTSEDVTNDLINCGF